MTESGSDNNKIVKTGQIHELQIDSVNQDGQGIGRLDGLAVFIPQTIPGDVALIRLDTIKPNYAVGSLVELLRASVDRINPVCPIADKCGGCSLQVMAYPTQLMYKQREITEVLRRIGKVEEPQKKMRPILGMVNPWHYRSKAQFPVSGTSEDPQIGFYASRSHDVVPSTVCPIQHQASDRIRQVLIDHIKAEKIEPYQENTHSGLIRHLVVRVGFATGDVMVILVVNGDHFPGSEHFRQKAEEALAALNHPDKKRYRLKSLYLNINKAQTNQILSEDCKLVSGQSYIEEIILGSHYRISPLSFFQVNPRQTEILYSQVLNMAGLDIDKTAIDLYCGTGAISIILASRAKKVIGIESVAQAVEDARINAEINRLKNTEFIVGKAETVLPKLVKEGLTADVAVIDPPRKGCDPALLEAVVEAKIPRIVYVSCYPATLARDIDLLQKQNYEVQSIQPVDMFPWTGHVETVVLMSRVNK